jgi:hypothetical protein
MDATPMVRPPPNLADITPDWLTLALSQRYPGTVVEAAEFGEAIHGTGTNLALTLRYARQTGGNPLPPTLWLKGGYEALFGYMAASRIYEIEPLFYRELASRLDVRVPRCYYAGNDETTHQGLMLLENLAASDATFEVRRGHERALLAHYLQALAAGGVAAPTMDDAWLAYRRYNAYGLFVKTVNPDMFKPRAVNVAWMSRHVAAAEDLETFASLGV